MGRRVYLGACLIILLLGAGFRLYRLAERSLWLDEAKYAVFAQRPVRETVSCVRLAGSSPLAYPLLLNAVQRVNDSALAVRLPSAVFSLASVAVVFCLPCVGFGRPAALIAGTVLAVSPSQIRYAQEVREYSLAVLLAAFMVYTFAGSLGDEKGPERRAVLLLGLFIAPLVQYGLVLFAVALLLTWAATGLRESGWGSYVRSLAGGAVALGAGCVATTFLTLSWQWRVTDAWYLRTSFYTGSLGDVPNLSGFLAARLGKLIPYLLLGDGSAVLIIPALGLLLLVRKEADRDLRLLVGLAFISIAIVAAAAVAHVYPLGPIRQDLFLAPAIAMALGIGWNSLSERIGTRFRAGTTAAFLIALLAGAVIGIVRANPYREQEDIKTVIARLTDSPIRGKVYVHYGAQPALRFYKISGPEFVYGRSHRGHPAEYAEEFRALVGAETKEVWLVFSHATSKEKQRLIEDLRSEWVFQPVVIARGASLYHGEIVANKAVRSEAGP